MTTMASGTLFGVAMMLGQGILFSVQLASSKVLVGMQWPYYHLVAASYVAIAAINLLAMRAMQLPVRGLVHPWVLLRAFFGVMTFVLGVMAVQLGTPMGDVSALMSINIVLAAVLGRMFLGEPIRSMHYLAVCLAFAGAVFISQPSFLFGSDERQGLSVGYVLAPIAGFCNAWNFICSRKCSGISSWYPTMSATVLCLPVFLILPHTPWLKDGSLATLERVPVWSVVAWILALAICNVARALMLNAGAKLCPAAVSATVGNTANLISGYAMQILFFSFTPSPVTIAGAGLMLASVAAMALARPPVEAKISDQTLASATSTMSTVSSTEVLDMEEVDGESEAPSLASFIASELSEYSLGSGTETPGGRGGPQVRLRRAVQELPAQTLGVLSVGMSAASA